MEQEKTTNKSKQSLKVTLSVGVVLLILTLSYGFLEGMNLLPYLTPKVSMNASKLELTYSDCSSNKQADCEDISADLEPGDSISKTFEVKNTGTVTLSYNLMFKEILNTFKNDELIYKIENMDDDTLVVPNDTPVPYVPVKETDKIIKEGIEIKAGKRHRYRLTVTFLNKDYNQMENESAVFNLKMGVSGKETYEITFDSNGGTISTTSKTVTYNSTYGDLPVPTNTGYNFLGWFTEAIDGERVTKDSKVTTLTDQTLYAHWGELLTNKLITKANPASVTTYASGTTAEMYSFTHAATIQTPAQTDYRYIGESPNNYIKFNDEIWRVLGVFPVYNAETDTYEDRVKIMRMDAVNSYQLVLDEDCNMSDDAAIAMRETNLIEDLNTDYYNKAGSYSSNGLNPTAQNQIAKARWYTNAANNNKSGEEFYATERSNTSGLLNFVTKDTFNYIDENVSLIYASDFKYTYGLGVHDGCFSAVIDGCYAESFDGPVESDPATPSWLYNSLNMKMMIVLDPMEEQEQYGMFILKISYDDEKGAYFKHEFYCHRNPYTIMPTVYLRPDIAYVSGDGTLANPYEIV